jgi:ribosomal protein L37AE/L43A
MFLDLLRQELGEEKFAGAETRFCCPFCLERKYKFYVHNEKGLWICFKCEEKGNPLSFVTEYFNVTFPEAVDILETYDYDVTQERDNQYSPSQYGADLTEEEQLLLFISRGGQPFEEEEQKLKYNCPSPPTNCKALVNNFENPEAFPFFAYLHSRGVTIEQIREHNISYVTYGEVSLLDGRKMNLVNHAVFFTFDDKRRPLYWNTRSIEKAPFIKSFNAPSRPGEYSKDTTVFNLNNAKNYDKIVVHEGVFNSFMTPGCGVATFGKMVTDHQVTLLLNETKERKQPIYLYLDTDAWKQMIASARKIKEKEPTREVYFVYSGTEEDANDLGLAAVQELVDNAFPANAEGELRLTMANQLGGIL